MQDVTRRMALLEADCRALRAEVQQLRCENLALRRRYNGAGQCERGGDGEPHLSVEQAP